MCTFCSTNPWFNDSFKVCIYAKHFFSILQIMYKIMILNIKLQQYIICQYFHMSFLHLKSSTLNFRSNVHLHRLFTSQCLRYVDSNELRDKLHLWYLSLLLVTYQNLPTILVLLLSSLSMSAISIPQRLVYYF